MKSGALREADGERADEEGVVAGEDATTIKHRALIVQMTRLNSDPHIVPNLAVQVQGHSKDFSRLRQRGDHARAVLIVFATQSERPFVIELITYNSDRGPPEIIPRGTGTPFLKADVHTCDAVQLFRKWHDSIEIVEVTHATLGIWKVGANKGAPVKSDFLRRRVSDASPKEGKLLPFIGRMRCQPFSTRPTNSHWSLGL